MIFMRIVDVWKQDNKILAYCIGRGIDEQFSCKEITVDGKHFDVTGIDILKSISGEISIVLGLACSNPQSVPHSEIVVVS